MGSSKKSKEKDRERNRGEKRKKRDRSRSRSRDGDKERHHHRHHHKHKKRRTKRVQERLSPSPVSQSNSLSDITISDGEAPPQHEEEYEEAKYVSPVPPEPESPATSPLASPAKAVESLSIEETNKIRMKLGLKPLQVDVPKTDEHAEVDAAGASEAPKEETKPATEDFVHKPAENLRDKLEVEKLREKIAAQREKRRIKEQMAKVRTLGESDEEDDSALVWVSKSRKLQREKQEAERKAKMLEELDAQFGIVDLVAEEMAEQKKKVYDHRHLSGLRVDHDISRFEEGCTTVLTLKDSSVLDQKEDILVNVNITDQERLEKNLKNKYHKPDEIEYEAPEVDEFGNIVQKAILTKYDEEIEGAKMSSFYLGSSGMAAGESSQTQGLVSVRKTAKLHKLQSLQMPSSQLATEYLTSAEMVGFRKVKKKKKKKMLTADDLVSLCGDQSEHHGSRHTRQSHAERMMTEFFDSTAPEEGVKSLQELMEEEDVPVKMEVDEEVHESEDGNSGFDDVELQEALSRSRRAKLAQKNQSSSEKITDDIKNSMNSELIGEEGIVMTLNTTDEFCRTLGDIPTYGLSGNRADEDHSRLQLSPQRPSEMGEARGAWEEVDIEDTRVEISDEITQPILEEEPDASKGIANALKLAMKKGYLEKEHSKKVANAALQHLRAAHYSIEDKAVEDDRQGRDRYSGPVMDFRERDGYKPDVKLEYVDDEGRKLNAKEAFRYLSHKFHGKGSGKNKMEKRMKKWQEEMLMKHMSSCDTPLQTLERQREKQKQLGSACLLLSGNKTQEAMEVKK